MHLFSIYLFSIPILTFQTVNVQKDIKKNMKGLGKASFKAKQPPESKMSLTSVVP